ncbi:MAG: serine hydrolase domain-containing protein, partial [Elusimicrobiota bacterium]|nr:serine hydrolase domain-containing protein [Elusimicrobiota bacterium]
MAIKIIKNKKFKILASETSKQMKELNVPGVAIGIIHGKKEYATGLGITSTENPLPVMENTLFQIGSISKPFLATAVMRLVEKKKIDLDIPITKYLPDLKLSTKETTKKVTMRHLLTHTGGWFGDHFKDFGDGDDALEKIVDDLEKLPQLSPLGKIWGYNNSGFYIAGRILEVIMKKPYAKIIKELILDPLDMKMTFFSAKDIMTYRFAVGHSAPKKHLKIIRPWTLPKSVAPAGKIISNVNDML